jgi:hypothetical protein
MRENWICPRVPSTATRGKFSYGRSGPLWVSGSVSDHQLERSSADPAGVINFANGQHESSEQLPACLDDSAATSP